MNPVESCQKVSVKTSYYQLLHTAYDRRLLPGTRDYYTRFLVLASGRTGSTLLIRTLGQHPQVIAYGELFRKLETFPEHYRQFARARALYRQDVGFDHPPCPTHRPTFILDNGRSSVQA